MTPKKPLSREKLIDKVIEMEMGNTTVEETIDLVEANTRLECQQEIAQLKELVREAVDDCKKLDGQHLQFYDGTKVKIVASKSWLAKAEDALSADRHFVRTAHKELMED
jgi:hypothetical protein